MNYFIIDETETGFHILGKTYWYLGNKITPLYKTFHTKEECYEWLDENYGDNYQVINQGGSSYD